MVTRADFSNEEWATIYGSPAMAGMVVMTAGKSGPVQAVQEMFAVGKAISDAEQSAPNNGLIKAIVDAVKNKEQMDQGQKPASIEQAHSQALDHIRQTVVLVNAKAPDEAAEFKQWLAHVGQRVAEAAKEGSFLGFGGTQVTEEEQMAIGELNSALGLS